MVFLLASAFPPHHYFTKIVLSLTHRITTLQFGSYDDIVVSQETRDVASLAILS